MRLVLPCTIILWSVPIALALRVDAASVIVPPLRSAGVLASAIALVCIAGVRWSSILARRHGHLTSIETTRYSLDAAFALAVISTGGVFFACWAAFGHTLSDALAVVLTLVLGTIGIGFVARQRRVTVRHFAVPIGLVLANAILTTSFAMRPPLVGGTFVPAMLATLALFGWDGVYARAVTEIREEVRTMRLPNAPPKRKVLSFSRPGSPDPPSAA